MSDWVVGGARRGWPWGLVGMIGLALMAELSFARGARLDFSSNWATDRIFSARGARPSAVVVDYKPRFLRCDPRDFIRPWSKSLDLVEGCELALTAGDAGFFATYLAGRLVPSARARHEIRSSLRYALANHPPTPATICPGSGRTGGRTGVPR